jgi:hypothetical protein
MAAFPKPQTGAAYAAGEFLPSGFAGCEGCRRRSRDLAQVLLEQG